MFSRKKLLVLFLSIFSMGNAMKRERASLGELLIDAVKKRNVEQTQELLKDTECDPNYTDSNENFPLHCVAYNHGYQGDDNTCKCNIIASLLIQAGAQVNRNDPKKETVSYKILLQEQRAFYQVMCMVAGLDIDREYTNALTSSFQAPMLYWILYRIKYQSDEIDDLIYVVKKALQYNAGRTFIYSGAELNYIEFVESGDLRFAPKEFVDKRSDILSLLERTGDRRRKKKRHIWAIKTQ